MPPARCGAEEEKAALHSTNETFNDLITDARCHAIAAHVEHAIVEELGDAAYDRPHQLMTGSGHELTRTEWEGFLDNLRICDYDIARNVRGLVNTEHGNDALLQATIELGRVFTPRIACRSAAQVLDSVLSALL